MVSLMSFAQDKSSQNTLNSTEMVKGLKACTYFYNLDKDSTLPKEKQIGFLAQDLLKIKGLENVVLKDDKGYRVDYIQIIPVLASALKNNIKVTEKLTIKCDKLLKENKELRNNFVCFKIISYICGTVITVIIAVVIKVVNDLYNKIKKNSFK